MDDLVLKIYLDSNSSPMNVLNGNLETIEAASFRDLQSKVEFKTNKEIQVIQQ